jgi:GntR family transcriptional repressor for pyruvate dehydrogenase complex
MDLGLRPVDQARETVSSETTRRLLDFLLSGRVKPGERIPSERSLSASLGVGRSVVREALKSLNLLGLIDIRQGDGTFLKRRDSELLPQAIEWGLLLGAKRITDLVEARHHLEVLLAGLAAQRAGESNIAEMTHCIAIMKRAKDPAEFVSADIAFHFEVATAAGNQSLLEIMRSIRALLQVWITRVMEAPGSSRPTYAEHASILKAIERHDAGAARDAMESHMEGATKRLQRTLDEHGALIGTEIEMATPAS